MKKKTAILYGVGIGPGDPELLTLKAARLLHEADVIAAPDTGREARTALNIVREHIAGKPILNCPAPMTRDRFTLERAWNQSADAICAQLEEGKTVVFITLGDPTIYSTYLYIQRLVLQRGYSAELVPGVPSFCAAAAKLNLSLCEGEQRLLIVPSSYNGLEESLNVPANKVFMKTGHQLAQLQDTLRQRGQLDKASLVVNCGLEGERVEAEFAQSEPQAGYFSIVILRES
ncbi:MAG: precorrin-2 C(20)-methyltransferase [Oscillospiraceae bacterium]|nr:precorrin-2 C(20)-methyltransferase [Oscillospiraceae bacterium]